MSEPLNQYKAGQSSGQVSGLCVVAAVLAAGLSRRMGEHNKLLQEINGVPMVRKVVEQALASSCDRVLVVLGHQSEKVRVALTGLAVQYVDNRHYEEGLAASVRAAAAATNPNEALLVCLGDMPGVSVAVFDQLINAYRRQPDKLAYQPAFEGKRGNPVLWAPKGIPGLANLRGDEGARSLLRKYADKVLVVPVLADGILIDIDTPEALHAARRQENFLRP